MRRRIYLFVILSILFLSLLFYVFIKREVISESLSPSIGIPDSSWLVISIDLNKIKKDIAWTSLLKGDLNKLFQTDTTTNSLIQLLKSPSDFGINETKSVYYFSKSGKEQTYHSLIFIVENSKELEKHLGGDSVRANTGKIYITRTKEGIWLYDTHKLLIVFNQEDDSLTALRYFNQSYTNKPNYIPVSDSGFISCDIHADYYSTVQKNPLLNNMIVHIELFKKNEELTATWTYKGLLTSYAANTLLPPAPEHSGIYFAGKLSEESLDSNFTSIPFYTKNKNLVDLFFSTIQSNTICCSFNGWEKIHRSYYVSEMNEEFNLELKKKDTTFNEPVFQIQVEQQNDSIQHVFLAYLKKEGLIIDQNKTSFKITVGNFDSELNILKNKSIYIQNKNTTHTPFPNGTMPGAFLWNINSSEIKGLNESNIIKPDLVKSLLNIKKANLYGNKDSTGLSGSLLVTFKDGDHPFLQLMHIVSGMTKANK
jgi:hypothetical protein